MPLCCALGQVAQPRHEVLLQLDADVRQVQRLGQSAVWAASQPSKTRRSQHTDATEERPRIRYIAQGGCV